MELGAKTLDTLPEISPEDRQRTMKGLENMRGILILNGEKEGDEFGYVDLVDQIKRGLEEGTTCKVDLGKRPAGGYYLFFRELADTTNLELGGTPEEPVMRIKSRSEISAKKLADRDRLNKMSDMEIAAAVRKLTEDGQLNAKLVETIVDHKGDINERLLAALK